MAKKSKTGDIFQISLPNDLGFAYAKCINLLELNSKARYPTLIRVYNYRSLIAEKPLESLKDNELILCPLLIAGIVPAIKNGSWKLIGNRPARDEEILVPHYKRPEPDEKDAKEWYYVVDADISKKVKSTYENVKHLEALSAIGS